MSGSKSPDFKPVVVLMDMQLLSGSITRIKEPLEKAFGRGLPQMDFVGWLVMLCAEAGIEGSDNEIQVLMVCDRKSTDIGILMPSDIRQLDGMATQTECGEMQFALLPTEDMVTTDAMLLDTLQTLLGQGSIRQLMIVPNRIGVWDDVCAVVRKARMEAPDSRNIADVMLFELGESCEGGTTGIRRTNVLQSLSVALGFTPPPSEEKHQSDHN